jgi:hypothetical protein
MAVTASSISSSNTLEQLRTQFNNLVSDVTGLEAGSQTFTLITSSNITVAEDGTIVFEGATNDDNETTLTVVDPTADRTISLPNASGTVIISDSSTNVTTLPDDLLIKDGGTIGNASVADVMTLASTGIVTFKDDLIIKDGGTIGSASATDAITIASTGIVTFVDDIIIKDSGTIGPTSLPGMITLASDGEMTLTSSTSSRPGFTIENTNADANPAFVRFHKNSGSPADNDEVGLINFDSDDDGGNVVRVAQVIGSVTDVTDGTEDGAIEFKTMTNGTLTSTLTMSSGNVTISATTANTSASDGALVVGGGVGVGADLTVGDDLRLITDSAVLSFGADSDTTLTHTDGSGLTINSTNKIMFRDSALSVSSSADGQLDIDADTEVEITATTVDINGDVEISGTTTQTGVSTSAAKDIFNAGMSVKNGSTSAGFIEFFEDSDNGTNKVTLIGPASTSDVTLTLPTTTDTLAVAGDITALAIALG